MEWYEVKNVGTIDSPALLVYADRAKENLRKAIEMAGSPDVMRPHVKTHKMAEICRMMMDAGIRKFKCATIAEAEMLAMQGAPDVLLAYQPAGPKADRLLQLVKAYPGTHFSALIDNEGTAKMISGIFSAAELKLDLYLDLNVGMNRSGIPPEKSLDLYKACKTWNGIEITGLHFYDGHIRDTDLTERKRKSDEGFERVMQLVHQISATDGKTMQLVAGGSPSFPTHTGRKQVTFSPGTFIFWDWGYKHIVPDEPFEYAALVLTRINSIIDETTFCCDLGHKAIAAENPLPRVHFLNLKDANPVGQSEEHLIVKVKDTSGLSVGDVLYGVPVHICPTVALYAEAQIVEEHEVNKQWKVIARNRTIHI